MPRRTPENAYELRNPGQTALLFRDNVPVVGVMIDFRGPEHKEAAWKSIMDLARSSGADAAGLILDVYCAPVGSGLAPSEDPAEDVPTGVELG